MKTKNASKIRKNGLRDRRFGAKVVGGWIGLALKIGLNSNEAKILKDAFGETKNSPKTA